MMLSSKKALSGLRKQFLQELLKLAVTGSSDEEWNRCLLDYASRAYALWFGHSMVLNLSRADTDYGDTDLMISSLLL